VRPAAQPLAGRAAERVNAIGTGRLPGFLLKLIQDNQG
jgi:hypothetical protein